MTAIISTNYRGDIVALDNDSLALITSRSRTCNPAALRQLICDVEMRGYTIDWDESTVARPEAE